MERLYTLIGFQIKLTPIENSVRFTYLAENIDILPRLKSAGDSSPRHLFRGGR